jgi:hypothetical protein
MTTKRKLWAMKRNWLIRRLKGASSIFSVDTNKLIHSLAPDENETHLLICGIVIALKKLTYRISDSKYKE